MGRGATIAGLVAGVLAVAVLVWPRRGGELGCAVGAARRGGRPRRPRGLRGSRAGPGTPRSLAPTSPQVAVALELLALALSAGAGLAESVEIVAERSPPAVRGDLLTVVSAVRWGWTWAQAWNLVDPCWAGARRAVVLAEAAGVAPGAPLARTAADLRAEHGIRLELAAARLGVRIVLPLGLAYLPAFVVLTVVPLVIALSAAVWA